MDIAMNSTWVSENRARGVFDFDRVQRSVLTAALDTLRRLDVPCAGVVLAESPNGVISAR